jgi:hypothetical protein
MNPIVTNPNTYIPSIPSIPPIPDCPPGTYYMDIMIEKSIEEDKKKDNENIHIYSHIPKIMYN